MKSSISVMIVGLLLVGCATPEERAAYQEAQSRAYTEDLSRQCTAVGFTFGTDPHRNCILQLHLANQQADSARRAAATQFLLQQQQIQQQNAYRPAPTPIYRAPVQTNCQRIGNQVNCTSY